MPDPATLTGTGRLLKNGVLFFDHVEALTSATTRGRGLLGRQSLPRGAAVLLAPCRGIHTFFMRFPLDVAFLDAQMTVLKVKLNVRPFKMVFGPLRATATLEWQSGWLPPDALSTGDVVEWDK